MTDDARAATGAEPEPCNCLAVRQAARAVSQFYDGFLAPTGLRGGQYSVLSKLARHGPLTVQALADHLVIDRTTLARTLRPLERDGLLRMVPADDDRRRKLLSLTPAGDERVRAARDAWRRAQRAFEQQVGAGDATELRVRLKGIVTRLRPRAEAAGAATSSAASSATASSATASSVAPGPTGRRRS